MCWWHWDVKPYSLNQYCSVAALTNDVDHLHPSSSSPKNHQLLISPRITSSLESTSCFILSALHCINDSADDVIVSNSSFTCSPLSSSITHTHTHTHSFQAQTRLFRKSFPPLSANTHPDCLFGLYWTGLTVLNVIFFSFLVIFLYFHFRSIGRLSWRNCLFSRHAVIFLCTIARSRTKITAISSLQLELELVIFT